MSLSDLPLTSGQKHRRVFERKFGFECRRNAEHIILVSPAGQVISVPNHDEVKRPTLKQILRACGIDDKRIARRSMHCEGRTATMSERRRIRSSGP